MEIKEFLSRLKEIETVILEVPEDSSENPWFRSIRAVDYDEKVGSYPKYNVGYISKGEFGLEHLMVIRLVLA